MKKKGDAGVVGFVKGFFKFIYVLVFSFFKSITLSWYDNFNDQWNAKPKKKGYKKIKAPDHIDYSKPKPDYMEVGSESKPSTPTETAGAAGNVFDIFG
jgi:hypothetical protein